MNPLVFYRIGNAAWRHGVPFVPWLMHRLCWLVCKADIPMECSIGKNVMFSHFGLGVVINSATVIKDNVIIYHGVTIGRSRGISDRTSNKLVCIEVGERVLIGAHAIILAKSEHMRIGAYSEIGAGAVVLCDVPENSVAVGNPARIFPRPSDKG